MIMLFESLPPNRNTHTIALYPEPTAAEALSTPHVPRFPARALAVRALVEVRNFRRLVFMSALHLEVVGRSHQVDGHSGACRLFCCGGSGADRGRGDRGFVGRLVRL